MFTKHANQPVDLFITIHWLLMSSCAGFMNAVAFIGLGTFATHVTGFATLFGVHAANTQTGNAIAALVVPLFFLVGALISGLCVEGRIRQNKLPHYDYVMYSCSILLVIASFAGNFQEFQPGQGYLHIQKNFILLSMICLTSGLLNAALSYSSSSTVRITHLTGVTTDLGRGIAELISLRMNPLASFDQELRLNLLRGMTILCFMLGAFAGAYLFHVFHFLVLLLPAICFAYAGIRGRRMRTVEARNEFN